MACNLGRGNNKIAVMWFSCVRQGWVFMFWCYWYLSCHITILDILEERPQCGLQRKSGSVRVLAQQGRQKTALNIKCATLLLKTNVCNVQTASNRQKAHCWLINNAPVWSLRLVFSFTLSGSITVESSFKLLFCKAFNNWSTALFWILAGLGCIMLYLNIYYLANMFLN